MLDPLLSEQHREATRCRLPQAGVESTGVVIKASLPASAVASVTLQR